MSNRTSEPQLSSFVPALVLLGFFGLMLAFMLPRPVVQTATPTVTPLPPTSIADIPTRMPPTEVVSAYSPELVAEGQSVYQTVCTACHGFDARGIPGLGKDLVESPFVHGLSDEELLNFIIMGRDSFDPLNTTGVAMPPRGGNPALTDEQIQAVVAYLRSLSDSPAIAQAAPTASPASVVQAAPTEMLTTPQATILPTHIPVTPQPFSAAVAYAWSCAGCHGLDGMGNAPFGAGIQDSRLLDDSEALASFLSEGRPPSDPSVEFPHPVRGGYPVLTDEQLSELTDYVQALVERAP
jgi:disulfide bond formation protein DsbB